MWPDSSVIFPAVAYDLPKTVADTIGPGEAPMATESDLDYRGTELAVSTVERCDACKGLQIMFA